MFYGLDLHKRFIQISAVDATGKELRNWKIPTKSDDIRAFAGTLGSKDAVVMETTFNTWSVYSILKESRCGKVVVANSFQVKAIATARIKTDKVDAKILAQLLRADFIPEVHAPAESTREARALIAHRKILVKHKTSFSNTIRAIFNFKLLDHPKALFGPSGRKWLAAQTLSPTERLMLENHLDLYYQTEEKIKAVDEQLVEQSRICEEVRLLMTIPGVGLTVATGIYAAIEDISRFKTPEKLASYFGLVPSVSQSGDKCYQGRITKTGTPTGRWLAVEAAQQMAIMGAPLTASYYRIRKKKGHNVAVTAVARKLIVVIWHMLKNNEPYRYASPTRQTKQKLRKVTPGFKQARTAEDVPVTIEEVYAEVKLPSLRPISEAEKRVLAVNRRVVTQGRKYFGFDESKPLGKIKKSVS